MDGTITPGLIIPTEGSTDTLIKFGHILPGIFKQFLIHQRKKEKEIKRISWISDTFLSNSDISPESTLKFKGENNSEMHLYGVFMLDVSVLDTIN